MRVGPSGHRHRAGDSAEGRAGTKLPAPPPRPTCGPPGSPPPCARLPSRREALTVTRQAGPAAAAVGSRSPAAPAPPPRALTHPAPPAAAPRLPYLPAPAWAAAPRGSPRAREGARRALGTRKGHPIRFAAQEAPPLSCNCRQPVTMAPSPMLFARPASSGFGLCRSDVTAQHGRTLAASAQVDHRG
ncbi:vegetative cell wall protein gp1-like [Mesocricetus auratus]|uniref:Vegetative cell wall protein gp1-like n=1 Tax=Mesocricetus auratus TaxID=10036 RepID=A0ABM2W5T9_MESAU|nr:vegetative cell wall protein gp1-like [Mesocricetus auratus]